MPVQMLRRNWSAKFVAFNALIAGMVGIAAVRVASHLGFDTDIAAAFAGTIGYMGAMTAEFVVMCIKEHYARKRANGDV
jgi:hypothetical protein